MSEEKHDEIAKGINESTRLNAETHAPDHGPATEIHARKSDVPKVNHTKDLWDKADIILKGIAAPVIVAMLGLFGSNYLAARERIEAERRLILELRSRQQEINAALKRDFLNSVMETFTRGMSLEQKLFSLELILSNFHESLNFGPLIRNLRQEIIRSPTATSIEPKLQTLMHDLVERQLLLLGPFANRVNATVPFDQVANREARAVIDTRLALPSHIKGSVSLRDRLFRVHILGIDKQKRELVVRLISKSSEETRQSDIDVTFRVSIDDLPLTNNTRLSQDDRCAVVITRWAHNAAEITLVYFPTQLTLD